MPTATISGSSSSSPTSVLALTGGEDLTKLNEKNESYPIASAYEYDDEMAPMDPRSCILRVGASAGNLCCVANQMIAEREATDSELNIALTELFASLWLTAKALRLDWVKSIRSKIALNAKKYPVEHCKGKSGKYTKYSHLTGITTTNQSTMDYREENDNTPNSPSESIDLSLAGFAEQHLGPLAEEIRIFAEDRLWTKYHTPRNLILALLGEVGELSEVLQYDGDDWDERADETEPRPLLVDRLHSQEPQKLDQLSQELADVSIYALRLATVCDLIDELRESLASQESPPDLEAKKLFT